eukprot:32815-Eustigmatos_ZCMA.PRE.1
MPWPAGRPQPGATPPTSATRERDVKHQPMVEIKQGCCTAELYTRSGSYARQRTALTSCTCMRLR